MFICELHKYVGPHIEYEKSVVIKLIINSTFFKEFSPYLKIWKNREGGDDNRLSLY